LPARTIEVQAPTTGVRPSGSITFIGTATVVIDAGGFRVLTDPNFLHQGQHAALGGGLRSRRLTEPAAPLTELLPIDVVVLSHHHGDHFDQVAERDLPKGTPIVTTAHAARKLAKQGFTNTHVLDTWEQAAVVREGAELTVTALPAKHAPQPLRAVLPPVMGSMLDYRVGNASYRLYVTGDTLMHDGLREIPQRYPGIDLALVHLGGTKVLGILLTMDGEQGAEALEVVDPDAAIPIHVDDYTVFKSPIEDFDRAVAKRGLRTTIHRLARGETFPFDFAVGPLPGHGPPA
jgi:L-ascorbate metabolism protein UlaG (beta-lactamase superfamily)